MANKDALSLAIIDNGSGIAFADWGFSWMRTLVDPGVCAELSGRRLNFLRFTYAYPSGALNLVTHDFLKGGGDRLIIVDLDQVWEPDDFRNLVSHDAPFVAGMYCKKKPKAEWVLSLLDEVNPFQDTMPEIEANRLVEVATVGRGFINLHRSVFDLMEPTTEEFLDDHTGQILKDYWKPRRNGHSEDYAFCDRYRELGGRVLVDQKIRIGHIGPQRYPIL